jgi:hypothetical protein
MRYIAFQRYHGVPEHKIFKSKIYTQAIYEYEHSNVFKDWVKNLFLIAETFRSVRNGKLPGYVQYSEVDSSLEITTFSELQFDCFAKTAYEVMCLHFDSTGTKVRVDDGSEITKFVHFKRILNHTVLIRNRTLIGEDVSYFQLGELNILNF